MLSLTAGDGVGLLKCRLCRHFFLFFFCLLRLWVCWMHEGLYGGLIWILTSTIDLDDVLFFFSPCGKEGSLNPIVEVGGMVLVLRYCGRLL